MAVDGCGSTSTRTLAGAPAGFELRPYQVEATAAVHAHLDGPDPEPAVLVMAVASGKTTTAAHVVHERCESGRCRRVLALGHTSEIVQQWEETLRRVWPAADIGVYAAKLGRRELGHRVTVASVQSVFRRPDRLGSGIDLILADEAHLCPASVDSMFGRTFAAHPSAAIVGMTGSPHRLDSGPLIGPGPDRLFRVQLADVTARHLIRLGYLVDLAGKHARQQIDTSRVSIRAGDFATDQLEAAATDAVGRVVDEALGLVAGRRTVLWFGVGVDHATALRDELRRRGELAELVVGTTPQAERERVLAAFADGTLRHVVNVAVLTAGYDCPPIDAIVMARPTCSPALWQQCTGRGLRTSPETGKRDLLLIDFSANWRRLGNPLAPRPPATGRKRRTGDRSGPADWNCEQCCRVNEPSADACIECGAARPVVHRVARLSRPEVVSAEDFPPERVTHVAVAAHRKAGRPPTLKVGYRLASGRWVCEWLAFESLHPFGRLKAREWWRARFDAPPPRTTAEALVDGCALAQAILEKTEAVQVDDSERWPQIVGHRLRQEVAPR